MRSIDKALHATKDLSPSWWNALFSILKITTSVMDTLDGIEDHALHFSVTQISIEQLDELKQVNLSLWRAELEVEWCNAKLYLFASTFTTPAHANATYNIQMPIHRQAILEKAFEVSSNLVTQFMKLGRLGASERHPGGLLKFVPELYFTSLFNATTFLFRFIATFMTVTTVQRRRAMGFIIEVHKIFQSYPGHREFTRAAIHIEALIDVLKQGAPVSMSELVVKNKMGASVMFDAIFHACRQRNIDPRTGRPLAVQDWRTVNETFAERLPKARAQKIGTDVWEPDFSTNMETNGLELDQSSQWWGEWDSYIDLFQIGGEEFDMDVELGLDDN